MRKLKTKWFFRGMFLLFFSIIFSCTSSTSFSWAAEEAAADADAFSWADAFTMKSSEEKVTFHGYAYFEFLDAQGDAPGGNNTFDQHVFEPFFGYTVSENVFAKIIMEFEHVGGGGDAEVNGQENEREFNVEQAEIDVTLPWETGTLGFGAILVPFGLENYYHAPSDNPLITRPRAFKDGGMFPNTFTDPGIQFTQKITNLGTFDAYIINGDARNGQVPRDNQGGGNGGKSIGAEIQMTELVKGLNVGASFIMGPWSENMGDTERLDSTRYGAHLEYQGQWSSREFFITSEFVAGTDEGDSSVAEASGQLKDKDVFGYYVTLGVSPADKWTLLCRIGNFDNDKEVSNNDVDEFSYGARYELYSGVLLKGEYRVTKETPKVDNDLFALQISATF